MLAMEQIHQIRELYIGTASCKGMANCFQRPDYIGCNLGSIGKKRLSVRS